MYRPKRVQPGFTLVELLVVIVVIGVLAGIIMAAIDPMGYRNRSENAVTISQLDKVATAVNAYRSANRDSCYPASQATLLNSGLIQNWPSGINYVYVDCDDFYVYGTHAGVSYNYICLGDSSGSAQYVNVVNATNCP